MSKRAGSTVVEVKGSHAVYVSQPAAVAAVVEQAAKNGKTSAAAAVTGRTAPEVAINKNARRWQ